MKKTYKFMGVYRSGMIDYLNHTYERILTRVRLTELNYRRISVDVRIR